MKTKPCTVILTIDGETRPAVAWARIGGISYNTLFRRIQRGIDPKAAVFAPMHHRDAWVERGDLPVYKPRRSRRASVRFDVGQLPRWGSVLSINFRSYYKTEEQERVA